MQVNVLSLFIIEHVIIAHPLQDHIIFLIRLILLAWVHKLGFLKDTKCVGRYPKSIAANT